MTSQSPPNPLRHLRLSDLRSLAQLATEATVGAARIAEGVHQSVRGVLGLEAGTAPGEAAGITGTVYRGVRGATQLTGKTLDTLLAGLEPYLELSGRNPAETPQRAAALAALNGVLGDRLAANGNPLATRMSLRYRGQVLDGRAMPAMPEATGKLVLLVHGLCMNDLQWHTGADDVAQPDGSTLTQGGHDHGRALASALGYTPVYLRYNTGLHISQNGQELSVQLEQLIAHWPVPVEDLTILTHSMGGLVGRSAVFAAQQQPELRWPGVLKHLIFLGTPHHGAPLERAGNWLDQILGSTPFTRPFTRLAQLRSAGVTDLRHGNLTDADWQGRDRFRSTPDQRQPVPLPEGVACFTIAATVAAKRHALADRLIGDGLVPLPSALGQSPDPTRSLVFAKTAQWIAYRTNHMQLLSSPEVARQIVRWLTPA